MQNTMRAGRVAVVAILAAVWTTAAPVRAQEGATDAAAAGDAAARAVIDNLYAVMLETLHGAQKLGYAGRFAKLAPAIAATFDLDFMAEKSVGKHWESFSAEERAAWRALFERNMVASYASRMGGFHGQEFRISGSEPASHATIMVRTTIADPKKDPISITYRMRETPAGWRVIDLFLKGTVSELALRRSDYAGVLRSGGFAALRKSLEDKIAEYEAKAG